MQWGMVAKQGGMVSMQNRTKQQFADNTKQLLQEKAAMQDEIQKQLVSYTKQLQEAMAAMQMKGGIQQQLADNTMKLVNMLINKLAAVEEDLKGLRDKMELKIICLRENLAEEVK